jgi:hypothetical protein
MGRLSHIRHKNKQKSSFSANGFVNGIQVSFADSQTNSSVHTYIKGFKIKLSLICPCPVVSTNHHLGTRPSIPTLNLAARGGDNIASKVGKTLMGRLSYIRHKNKQESSFSANGFVK